MDAFAAIVPPCEEPTRKRMRRAMRRANGCDARCDHSCRFCLRSSASPSFLHPILALPGAFVGSRRFLWCLLHLLLAFGVCLSALCRRSAGGSVRGQKRRQTAPNFGTLLMLCCKIPEWVWIMANGHMAMIAMCPCAMIRTHSGILQHSMSKVPKLGAVCRPLTGP